MLLWVCVLATLVSKGTARLKEPGLQTFTDKEDHIQLIALEKQFHLAGVSNQQTPTGYAGTPILPPLDCDEPTPSCNPNWKFYSIRGTCNNLANPFWGASNRPFRRLVSPEYGAFSAPRGPLPNPRQLSVELHQNDNNPETSITHMVAIFGQFVDHDITLTPEADRHCCKGSQTSHKDCFPIEVPENDPFYSVQRPPQHCLEFSRSFPFCTNSHPVREQFNAITAFVDASNIYGSDEKNAQALRTFSNGLLKTGSNNLLPFFGRSRRAGDVRAGEQPGLTSMHTVWMREHNRLAADVKDENPSFNDEMIYLKTRQLVAAELQNIVYSEWLPVILGDQLIQSYQLSVSAQTAGQYTSQLDPSVINSFATAAFRFGHSLIQGRVQMSHPGSYYDLRHNFFDDTLYSKNSGSTMESMLYGQTRQTCQKFDRFITEDVTKFLFPEPGHNFGSDLMARNIQRGRDHGLPGYIKFRLACDLSETPQVPEEMTADNWDRLTTAYTNLEDIDLFSAGLLENKVTGGVVGPTFGCIIGKQFNSLKFGDRFFFTHVGQAGSLTAAEFTWARGRTMRDILCDNTSILRLKHNVFLNDGSPLSYCRRQTYLTLTPTRATTRRTTRFSNNQIFKEPNFNQFSNNQIFKEPNFNQFKNPV